MDFWWKKLRTRADDFDSLRMWLTAACLSACLLRSGALRVTFRNVSMTLRQPTSRFRLG